MSSKLSNRHLPIAGQPSEPGLPPWAPPADEHEADAEGLLQVGDIARATGKTVRAIHHYEEVGLLKPHARSKGRYRLFDATALTRVRWIGKLHDLGLSLAQIQQMIAAWESAPTAPGAMAKMRAIYAAKLEETRAQIEHLAALEAELSASIHYLDTCDTCDPAELVSTCASCSVHGKGDRAPELVAGIHHGRTSAARAATTHETTAPNLLARG